MKLQRSFFLAMSVSFAMAVPLRAEVITITPDDVIHFGYQLVKNLFDAQPDYEPGEGTSVDEMGEGGGTFINEGRGFAIDFGENFADVVIEKVYVGLKLHGTNPTPSDDPEIFWSNYKETNDYRPEQGDVVAPDFGLFSWEAELADKSWQLIYDGPPVTPAARYYVWRFDGTGGSGNRMQEIVFWGKAGEK